VRQIANDIVVLTINFASGMSAVTIVKGFKIDDAESLGKAQKSFFTFKVLIGHLFCTLHSPPILFNETYESLPLR
jgi:hypothetical protein